MHHKLYRVTDFELLQGYEIRVRFDDDFTRVIDFLPLLYGEMWGPLRDISFFNQVTIDPVAHTLTWPNDADFDPETLYNWPEYVDELTVRARQWAHVTV